MCFSPEADLAVGVVVSAVGVDALRHVRRAAELPLAALPVVLGVHQVIEAFVWWGLRGSVPAGLWHTARWLYLAIAFGVLPILVPLAVRALEPVSNLRRLRWFVAIGVAVSAVLMYAVVRGPVEATVEGHRIAYRVDLWHGGLIVALYVVATCGSMLMSTHENVRWFGAANFVAACALTWLDKTGFISLWCLWAAVTSVAIAAHLRHADQSPVPLASTAP